MFITEQSELTYFDTVRGFINSELEKMKSAGSEAGKQLREAGKEFFADNPLGGLMNPMGLTEHHAAMEELLETSDKLKREIRVYERLKNEPYFGRVDFEADGAEPENVYVGLRTLADLSSFRFYVYDWRAPVSSLFYAGETGRASYTSPKGSVDGIIRGIRQYKFGGGELLSHWDAELRINDSVLRDVLSSGSGEKLKTIVNTIQREQNSAIRHTASESLIVTGPAGCGKTSVGMHRLAWLLYEMRTSLLSPDILMFTANEAFRSYVAGVLPELGEDEIEFGSLNALFSRFIRMKTEPQLKQTEAVLTSDAFRLKNASAVYDEGFIKYIEDRTADLSAHFRTLSLLERTVLSADTLKRKYASLSSALTPSEKLELLSKWAADEIKNWFRINGDFVRETAENAFPAYVDTKSAVNGIREKFLSNARKMILSAVLTDPTALYRRFFSEYCGGELSEALGKRLKERSILFEDAAAILYIGTLTGAYRTNGKTLHILIDEAQDMPLLLHKALRKLYPKAVFTVLADVEQAIVPTLNTCDISAIAGVYGAEIMRLGKSFRSTKQISEFAKRYLDRDDYEVFDRSGKEPMTLYADDHVKTTAEIIKNAYGGRGSVCVILPTVKQTSVFYAKLHKLVEDCTAVTDADSKITSRVVCMPVALTKGMEFDAVILPYFDEAEKNRRIAYMMTTRALHELYMIKSGE